MPLVGPKKYLDLQSIISRGEIAVDENNTDVNEFVFFENDLDILAIIRDCFEALRRFFGEETCSVLAFSFGRGLGERLYKLAIKQGVRDLSDANSFLIQVIKRLRLARDAAIFTTRSRDESVCEVFIRIASSGRGEGADVFSYILRGVLFQFYRLLTLSSIRILSTDRSDSLTSCYEYVVRLSKGEEALFDE